MLFAEQGFDPELASPGVIGFVATAFVGIITILLLIDMVRRLRKVNMRADINAKLDAEASSEESSSTS